jgi:hypothetical protein
MSELPDRPDPDQLRRQARELLRAARGGEPQALSRIGAVSDQLRLSAAQLALAREYGFPSWPALRAEAENRRRVSDAASRSALPNNRHRAPTAGDYWSFGGATAIRTAAGTLSPSALLVGAGCATLDASLTPSAETQRRLAGPRRVGRLLRPVTAIFGGHPAHSDVPRFDDLVLADDRGATYTLSVESEHIPREIPGMVRGPIELRLALDRVPPSDCEWLELRNEAGSATRLIRSAQPAIRLAEPEPAAGSPAERELSDQALSLIGFEFAEAGQKSEAGSILRQQCAAVVARVAEIRQAGGLDRGRELPDQIAKLCAVLTEQQPADGLPAGWLRMLDATRRTDGPAYHFDIAADLPSVGGVTMHLATLISEPASWRVHLKVTPGWWSYSDDRRHTWAPISVHAEDNLDGMYVSNFGGSHHRSHHEEVALSFRPRLDPLADTLRLTFTGAAEQIAVEIRLSPAPIAGALSST